MERVKSSRLVDSVRAASLLTAVLVLAGIAVRVDAAANPFVRVQAHSVPQTVSAYGQVEPIATVQLRTPDAGILGGLHVVPGSEVKAGEVLARMVGPHVQALLVARVQQLRAAQARESAVKHSLAIVRRQFDAQLATRQALDAARAELASARAATRTAAAGLQEARSLRIVRAPVAGTILAVQSTNGEQLGAGQAIATLQPAGRLWIRAEVYGAEASRVRVGMTGRFKPADAQSPATIEVASISPALAADGGMRIGLVPTTTKAPRWWVNGQWGSLVLEGPIQHMVLVPTQSLILDRGHWWVLVHTPAGDEPRQVVPGRTQGWWTAITSGLSAGQDVVVTDAFLEYHRGIASHYTPPD